MLPGNFNKACSTYFGGYYKGLYSGTSDEEFDYRFTNRKAMTFLHRARDQKFLGERKVGEWSFPCEVIALTQQEMVLKQWIPVGSEQDYVEPDFKDTEIRIVLEPEMLEFIYVYSSSAEKTDYRGMHIEASWYRLSDNTWYMDQVTVLFL